MDEMAQVPKPFRLDELLAHRAWVRNVALALVGGDAARADDLEQDVWLAVVRQPPETRVRSPRAWMRRALQFRALNARRTQKRRRHY